jgi:hypothetical protein
LNEDRKGSREFHIKFKHLVELWVAGVELVIFSFIIHSFSVF